MPLKINNLHKHYEGVHAVDGLSVEIPQAKITGIIGPNGSGKSTLVNLLTGFVPTTRGSISFGKGAAFEKIKPWDVAFYGVTRTFQNVRLFEQMSVLDNILVVTTERGVFASLFEKHKDYHLQKARTVLERVGLWDKRNQLTINLSYGQRKLLEIARTLAMDAKIYLFDEPFAGLFPEMVKTVSSILEQLRDQGHTVVLIEHNMDLIQELSDHVIVMEEGKLLAQGAPRTVLQREDVIEAYLGK